MAVAMVDNSHGCLNPFPVGKTTSHNQRHEEGDAQVENKGK